MTKFFKNYTVKQIIELYTSFYIKKIIPFFTIKQWYAIWNYFIIVNMLSPKLCFKGVLPLNYWYLNDIFDFKYDSLQVSQTQWLINLKEFIEAGNLDVSTDEKLMSSFTQHLKDTSAFWNYYNYLKFEKNISFGFVAYATLFFLI